RPGIFGMKPFQASGFGLQASAGKPDQRRTTNDQRPITNDQQPTTALRRCRQPVPARVAVSDGRPVRVTTDRHGFAGGSVVAAAGPWRSSGEWWKTVDSQQSTVDSRQSTVDSPESTVDRSESTVARRLTTVDRRLTTVRRLTPDTFWDRDEWDVTLSDGA